MKIIALDQSTTATGVAIFEDKRLVTYLLIKPKKSKKVTNLVHDVDLGNHIHLLIMPEDMYGTTLNRTTAIVDVLEKIFEAEKPDKVWFEDIFENKNPEGFKSLARLQGFIAHLCHTKNIPYIIKEESAWTSVWGSYSNKTKRDERKADIMKKVNDYYNLNITVDDISDSIGIGRYAVEKGE